MHQRAWRLRERPHRARVAMFCPIFMNSLSGGILVPITSMTRRDCPPGVSRPSAVAVAAPAPARANVITDWDEKAVVAVTPMASFGPPMAQRMMAMVHAGCFYLSFNAIVRMVGLGTKLLQIPRCKRFRSSCNIQSTARNISCLPLLVA
jgi:hypothetical protein